ncbi:N-acetylmuramoyl-L-alanine amidase [Puia sp. P3]|uniref:N-acetylmuramoyl-L-alanine amidase n=1 Tax=Puia sp. P3 TaxID=3423952 RepID=UPI003D664E86
MRPWQGIVGQHFTPAQFDQYVQTLHWITRRPSFIVLHNTAIPKLGDLPNGFSNASMQGFVNYYRDEQHWSAGPHLFVDDHFIWAFTPMTTPGVHSPSWNNQSIGIEMLGNYQTDDFNTGRGLAVRKNAMAAITSICSVFGWTSQNIRLHHEDPLTDHKDCPGKFVIKTAVQTDVDGLLAIDHPGEHDPTTERLA